MENKIEFDFTALELRVLADLRSRSVQNPFHGSWLHTNRPTGRTTSEPEWQEK